MGKEEHHNHFRPRSQLRYRPQLFVPNAVGVQSGPNALLAHPPRTPIQKAVRFDADKQDRQIVGGASLEPFIQCDESAPI